MYGHGHPQPQQHRPSQGVLVGLRVLFVALPLLTCGFLAFAPLIRLAVVTRRKLDWVLCGVFLVADVSLFTYIGVTGEETSSDLEAFLGVGAMMALVVASVAYYLVAEIQHYAKAAAPAPAGPPPVVGGYGYPPTAAATVPSPGYPRPQPMPVPPPHPQPQPMPVPPPQPQPQPVTPPASHSQPRIDQVRAELDELSHLLRKEEEK